MISNKEKNSRLEVNCKKQENVNSHSNFEEWLNTFEAKKPEYQNYCLNALKTNVAESQFSQDMWLFNNIFKTYALQDKKGFYIDSGANEWKYFSNTFFYDVCLGWDGLCIEPNANYHDGLRKYRSCKLITECISDKAEKKGFVNAGGGSHVIDGDLLSCNTLTSMLGNQKKVDLWSLDVEKHELEILGKVDFKSIEVSVLLVEDFWLPYGSLDSLLLNGSTGFLKMTQMPVDSVFVHRNMFRNIMNNIEEYWYPSNWNDYVENNKAFREQKIKENVLTY